MLLDVNLSYEFSKLIICNLDTIILTWNYLVNNKKIQKYFFKTTINLENFSKDKQR